MVNRVLMVDPRKPLRNKGKNKSSILIICYNIQDTEPFDDLNSFKAFTNFMLFFIPFLKN